MNSAVVGTINLTTAVWCTTLWKMHPMHGEVSQLSRKILATFDASRKFFRKNLDSLKAGIVVYQKKSCSSCTHAPMPEVGKFLIAIYKKIWGEKSQILHVLLRIVLRCVLDILLFIEVMDFVLFLQNVKIKGIFKMIMEKISSQNACLWNERISLFSNWVSWLEAIMLRRRVKRKLTGGCEFDILDGTDIMRIFYMHDTTEEKF